MRVPSPSCPLLLFPQHRIFQLSLRAQLDQPAAANQTIPVSHQVTIVGTTILFPLLPLPTWPLSLNPRHRTVPSFLRAQE